jgi:hypothetical protein
MLQNLLQRCVPPLSSKFARSGVYDAATAAAVAEYQQFYVTGAAVGGVADAATFANVVARLLDDDGYEDDGEVPAGYKYKLHIPVFANRSAEVSATLFDASGVARLVFRVRAHGVNLDSNGTVGEAASQLASDGVTPTGLAELDLQSPEDDPVNFGPYPVNRFVRGLKGNMAIGDDAGAVTLVSDIRDGLLVHTGEWAGWNPSMPMPNSHGCVHGHPADIDALWQILTNDLGVAIRNNTNGHLPYPYTPQGLVSVERVRPGSRTAARIAQMSVPVAGKAVRL